MVYRNEDVSVLLAIFVNQRGKIQFSQRVYGIGGANAKLRFPSV